jgi:23S rRNA pseudouridine2457 synthase
MINPHYKYFLLNKPYGVLSQFTDKDDRLTLSSIYNFSKNIYPVGRLDLDSEGILLLTNDKSLTDYLLNPKKKHEREYYVQVEGIPTKEALKKLQQGIELKDGKTLPAKVKIIDDPQFVERIPPIRERKNIPATWISITLTEGKNRQVRRMTAAVGYPTLRLIRVRIKNLMIGDLQPGELKELKEKEIKKLVK